MKGDNPMVAHPSNILPFAPRPPKAMQDAKQKPQRGGKREPLPRLTITIPNYGKYQKAVKGRRDWASVSRGIGRNLQLIRACEATRNGNPGILFVVLLTLADNAGTVAEMTAKELAFECVGLDPRTIKNALDALAEAGVIEVKANAKQTLSMQRANTEHAASMQWLHEEPHSEAGLSAPTTDNRQLTTDKEKTKAKKARFRLVDTSPEFQAFMAAYPRGEDVRLAWEEWQAINPTPEIVAEIMAGLDLWLASQVWTDDGGKWVKYAHRWLRDGKWTERPQPARQPPPEKAKAQQQIEKHTEYWKEHGVDW
jgi:Fe2+ or Zn2+ uptake regulation protein